MDFGLLGRKYNDYLAYSIRFLGGLNFVLPIWFFFYTQYLGLSITQSTMISLISTGVSMVFEIPTGTWADKYGRKRIYLIGSLIGIIGFLPLVLTKDIVLIVMGSIVGGFGFSLVSGTLGSLIYDWFKGLGKEDSYKVYTRRGSILLFLGRAVATITGGRLFILNPLYPYYLYIIVNVIQLGLACLLYEESIVHEYTETSTILYIKQGWKYLTSSYSLNTVLIGFVVGFFFGSVVWGLYQPFLKSNGLTIPQIGRFFAGASLISMFGSQMTKYIYKGIEREYLLTIVYVVLTTIALTTFIFLQGLRILTGIVCLQLAFGMHTPIINNAINQHIPSSHRATANSIFSLLDSSGRFVGGSICGYLLTQLGFIGTWSILLIGSILLLVYLLSRRKYEISIKE